MPRTCRLALLALLLFSLPAVAGDGTEKHIFFEYYRRFGEAFRAHVEKNAAISTADLARKACLTFGEDIDRAIYPDKPKHVAITNNSCYAHVMLLKAGPHDGYRPESYAEEELYRRLDFKSFLNSSRQKMEEENQHAFADLKGYKYSFEGNYAVYRDDGDWHEGACILSDADLNGNGEPDWLINVEAFARTGTLRSYSIVVAYDVKPTGLIKVEDLIPPD